ncbi:MAG TPA: hypothetical protein VK147_06875 [Candidatus Didemnitutus sp.]|nr:hypothetical protein [Candidatus Didemnitutus sp.]
MIHNLSLIVALLCITTSTALAGETCTEKVRTCLETHLAWLNSPSWKAIDYVVETMTVGAAAFTDTVHVVSGPGYFYSTSKTNSLIVDEDSFVTITHPAKTVLLRKGQAQPESAMQNWNKLVSEIVGRKVLACDIAGNQLRFVTDPKKKNGANAEFSMEQLSIVINIETCRLIELERTFIANGRKQMQKITVLSSKEVEEEMRTRVDPESLVYDANGKLKPELKDYVVKDLR